MDNNNFEIRGLTNNELNSLYGNRKYDIGKCFINNDQPNHYYMQREKDVLHVRYEKNNNGYLINNLHVGFFNDKRVKLKECSLSKFNEVLLLTLVDLDIYKYIK